MQSSVVFLWKICVVYGVLCVPPPSLPFLFFFLSEFCRLFPNEGEELLLKTIFLLPKILHLFSLASAQTRQIALPQQLSNTHRNTDTTGEHKRFYSQVISGDNTNMNACIHHSSWWCPKQDRSLQNGMSLGPTGHYW